MSGLHSHPSQKPTYISSTGPTSISNDDHYSNDPTFTPSSSDGIFSKSASGSFLTVGLGVLILLLIIMCLTRICLRIITDYDNDAPRLSRGRPKPPVTADIELIRRRSSDTPILDPSTVKSADNLEQWEDLEFAIATPSTKYNSNPCSPSGLADYHQNAFGSPIILDSSVATTVLTPRQSNSIFSPIRSSQNFGLSLQVPVAVAQPQNEDRFHNSTFSRQDSGLRVVPLLSTDGRLPSGRLGAPVTSTHDML